MRQKIKAATITTRDIQDTINIPNERWIGAPLAFDIAGEALIDLKERWLKDGFSVHVEICSRLVDVHKFNRNTFDGLVQAIYSPCFPALDFLALTLLPHAGLRPVWKLLFGIDDGEYELDHYEIRILQRIYPRDVVALWLQSKASDGRWRRKDGALYLPVTEDYQDYPVTNLTTSFVVRGETVTLSGWEYLDRWYLGTGGLAGNWRRLALRKGFVVQCTGKLLEGNDLAPLLSPPFNLDSEIYLSQLITGAILPYHYPKILGDWLYGSSTFHHLGIGSHSNRDNPT